MTLENWTALRNHLPAGRGKHIVHGNAELLGCRDCIVYSDGDHLVSGMISTGWSLSGPRMSLLSCKDTSTARIKELLKKISLKEKFLKHL